MTAAAWVALAVFAVAAAVDWVAVATRDRRLEYGAKPAATAALVGLAAALDVRAGLGTRQVWFVVALACSLAGDVLLMLPSDRFAAGLAAFLTAHICYLTGFWVDDAPSAAALGIAAAVTVVLLAPVAVRVLRALRAGDRGLVAPVGAYVGAIAAMVASALASGRALAGGGALAFAGSDSMIAWSRFVRSYAGAAVAIMVTYHLGQLGLVLSLL